MGVALKKSKVTWVFILTGIFLFVSACHHGGGLRGLKERREQRKEARNERKIAGRTVKREKGTDRCDPYILPISSGYGSNGTFSTEPRTLINNLWDGEPITVFFPSGKTEKTPVVFFSHAYGGSEWKNAYPPLIDHITSKGYILVYSPYPTFGTGIDKRYEILWNGFELAVKQFKNRMDLTRVAFAGHSFGGGATPNMAWRGIVQKGWGSKGAFMYSMAPWYSFQMDATRFNAFPDHMLQLIQVYDKDDINDHRMAIDIFRSTGLPREHKIFSLVRSQTINGCQIITEHATPGRNPSLRLKAYAIFRPFDALADYAFNGNRSAMQALNGSNLNLPGNYQPMKVEQNPTPRLDESNYIFKWNGKQNPRTDRQKW